jgi:hypothetical protein
MIVRINRVIVQILQKGKPGWLRKKIEDSKMDEVPNYNGIRTRLVRKKKNFALMASI